MIKIGIVGYGYWGPNLARNVNLNNCTELVAIADTNIHKLQNIKKLYPNVLFCTNVEEIFPLVDAVIIATNVEYHYALAKKALELNKHVLIEKPATNSLKKLFDLYRIAKEKKRTLMIDYTFLYNGAVRKLNEIIHDESFGEITYIDSIRINLGIFQSEVNVIWDLASHDISIINFLLQKLPISVQATGISHLKNSIENIAYITLNYTENIIVHIHCSWTSPVKIRQMLIGGKKKMIVYNDIEPTDKLRVYDFDFHALDQKFKDNFLVDYRLGDISMPKFETDEPLYLLIDDFQKSIASSSEPISSIQKGLLVSCILEAAQKSVKMNGKLVKINYLI